MRNSITRVLERASSLLHNSAFQKVCLAALGAIVTIQALHTSVGVQFEIGVSEINARSALIWWMVQLASTAIWILSSTLAWWAIGKMPYLRHIPVLLSGLLCFWTFWLVYDGQFWFDPNFTPLIGVLPAVAPWIDIASAFFFRFAIPFVIWVVIVGRVLHPERWQDLKASITRTNERLALVSLIALALIGLFMTTTRVPVSTDLVAKKWQSVIIEPALLGQGAPSTVVFDDKNYGNPTTLDIDVFNIGSNSATKSGRQSNEFLLGNATPLLEFLQRNGALINIIDIETFEKGDLSKAQAVEDRIQVIEERMRVIERLPASQLLTRYNKMSGSGAWCSVQVDQGFAFKPEIASAIAAFDHANGSFVSASPFRSPGLYVAPLHNQVQGIGEGFSMTGQNWTVLSQPVINLDWPFDGGAGQVTSFWSNGPIRVFVEKSKLELGLGTWCGEGLRQNPRRQLTLNGMEHMTRITAELPKSGWFDLPPNTNIVRPSKYWPQPVNGTASTFRSDNIDGYLVINGEARELQSGTSVRITNLTGMNADPDRARLHGRSSDMALGGFMMSKRLIVYLSWEYWSAIAALILCYFGWREHIRRRYEKPSATP